MKATWPQIVFYAVWLGLVVTIVSVWLGESQPITSNPSDILLNLARLSGLMGAFLLLWQLVLISRAPWLEQIHGYDQWTRIHRVNGLAAFLLITLHIPLVVGGYGLLAQLTPPQQILQFWSDFAYIPLAIVGYILLVVIVLSSVSIVRKKAKYELWYGLHLLNYVVLGIVFWHQVAHGLTLSSVEWFLYMWYGLHILVVVHLLINRFALGAWLWWRHWFYVERIEREAGSVTSVYISGRHMERFRFEPGQFAKWRFLQKGLWREEHPFTISQAYNGITLRLSVKAVGDFTSRLDGLVLGSRVLISQPLGDFTLELARHSRLLLVGGGIGITPLRAMLEAAPDDMEVDMVYVVQAEQDAVFLSELKNLTQPRNKRLHLVTTRERAPEADYKLFESGILSKVLSDSPSSVYICGPDSMVDDVSQYLRELGVDDRDIHTERFSF